MSRPSTSTWPLLGRSSPPRICSRVVLPEPEAPTIATRSPAATASAAPRSTSSVTGPWRKLFETSRASSTGSMPPMLLMAQRLCRSRAAGAPGRIDGCQRAEEERHAAYAQHVEPLHVGRKITHVVHPRVQEPSMEQPLETADERLQVVGDHGAERRPEQRPGEADDDALDREDREHVARLRAEGAQDRDVGLLLLDDHDEGRDDVEGRHRDDHREHDE